MGNNRQWEIIEANMSWSNMYHFAAAAVWCALGFNVRWLLISRVPEAKDDGVLCLVIVDEGSSFLMTWKKIK